MSELTIYPVWDAVTRWFHWINVLCVIALIALGLVILNASTLGIPNPGKVQLKSWHVWVGYVFAINLAIRIVWAFVGGPHARWRELLPGGRGYVQSVRDYVQGFMRRQHRPYLGHNPLGRLAIAVLLLLLVVQAISGLILAGTDLFLPPFGHWIAQWVAAPGVEPSTLVPYAPALYDKTAYADMRAWREPVITVHLYNFYLLTMMIMLHVAAVIVTELREGGSLISAMFTGRKILSDTPVDSQHTAAEVAPAKGVTN